MNRLRYSFSILLLMVLMTQISNAQDPSPWQQVVPLMEFGYGGLRSVYWSPTTAQLAVHSSAGIQFYDADLSLTARRWFAEGEIHELSFSPDFKYVAVNEAQGLIVRQTDTWLPALAISNFRSPSWSPDSRYLAVWVGGSLQVWDVAKAQTILKMDELVSDGGAVQWSPDSQVIAVPADNSIIMFRVDNGAIVRVHDTGYVADFDWSLDGRWFVMVGLENPIPRDYNHALLPLDLLRMDAVTGEIVMRYPLNSGFNPTVNFYTAQPSVSISPNGQYISAQLAYAPKLDDEQWHPMGMSVWELESGLALTGSDKAIQNFQVPFAAWSPDGSRFAAAVGETLQIFEMATGSQVNHLPAYLASSEQTAWGQTDDQIIVRSGLWDVSGGQAEFLDSNLGRGFAPHDIQRPATPYCTNESTYHCPPNIAPKEGYYDYDKPLWTFELLYYIPERRYAVTYEIEIEYPGTPEYEDGEPPWERFVILDTETGDRLDERLNMSGEQTAYIYDHEGANYIESESRAFNVLRNTTLLSVDDDEIMDLRYQTVKPLEGVNRWEWREAWFSPDDGQRIYAYDTDFRFKAFDPFTGNLLYQTVPAPRDGIAYSLDYSLTYITDNRNTLYIYNTQTGEPILDIYTGNHGQRYLWNEDRSLLAIGGENKGIILVDVENQERLAVLRGHEASIANMAWNPYCNYAAMQTCRFVLASTDSNGKVILWGFEEGRLAAPEIAVVPLPELQPLPEPAVDFATLEPIWAYLATTDDYGQPAAQSVYWAEEGIMVNYDTFYQPDLNRMQQRPASFSLWRPNDVLPSGRAVLSDGTILNSDGTVLAHVAGQANDAVFDPSGERVLTAEGAGSQTRLSGSVGEYSSESGQFISRWARGNFGFNHIAYSPNRQWIATSSVTHYGYGGRIQIWFEDRFNTQYSSLIGHTKAITDFTWDGEAVVSASYDGTVRRWDIHTGYSVARWDHPDRAPITQVDWLEGGLVLVSAGQDLYVLDAITLQPQRELTGVGGRSFDWSPDGNQLITVGGDWLIRIVDFASGEVLATEASHMPSVTQLAWKPDGSQLAVVRQDGSIGLLDGTTGVQVNVLRMGGLDLTGLEWSPDGRYLLLERLDGVLEIVDGTTGHTHSEIFDPWRRNKAVWSPNSQSLAYATYPNPAEGIYDAPSWLKVVDLQGSLLQQMDLEWRDLSFYWEKKPFYLAWSPTGDEVAAFYDDRARVWSVETGTTLSSGVVALKTGVVLAEWEGDVVTFWTSQDTYQMNGESEISHLKESGIPANTIPRPDGQLIFGNQQVIDLDTGYPFQAFNQYHELTAVEWHPSCWSTDCQYVLALAQGSQVIMYGYPQKD